MLQFIITYRLDVVAFALLAIATALAVHLWLRRREQGGLPRLPRVAIVVIVILSAIGADIADHRERDNLRERLEGLAPTYALEVELMNHAKLGFDTPADSPDYLKIINAEIRWESVNRNVSDIYTYRRKADGSIAFVVDSETDYNHNGKYDEEREQRTAIGENYPDPPPNFSLALTGVASFDGEPYADRWGTWMSAYVPLHDKDGKTEAALGVDFDASQWIVDVALNRLGALAIAGVVLAVVIGASAIIAISKSELGKRMALQRQLVDASRQAGMAEVATGVLHNVGNVLNSVNVSAGVLTEKVRASKVAGFAKAATMIRDHRKDLANFVVNDPKGKVLPDYLVSLSGVLTAEQEGLMSELSQLGRSLDHIKQVVASQQTFAKVVAVDETFELSDLIEDALRINVTKLEPKGIRVERKISACPSLTADRHKVLQILVNLIGNASDAMADAREKKLTISLERAAEPDAEGRPVARLSVADRGMGIKPEDLTKLFKHGFTTRAEGHGFGLHFSAIAAHNMGGKLSAASKGPGHGATFTLEIPLSQIRKGAPECQPA